MLISVGTFSGEATLTIFFLLPFSWRSTLKGKTLLQFEQMILLRIVPYVEAFCQTGKQAGSHENCFPMCKSRAPYKKGY